MILLLLITAKFLPTALRVIVAVDTIADIATLTKKLAMSLKFSLKPLAKLIKIAAEHILKTRQKLNQILAENTGQPLDVISIDTERDNFMSAQEAKEYGLIDEVLSHRS